MRATTILAALTAILLLPAIHDAQRFGGEAKMPAPTELKVSAGAVEGHRTPLELVGRAIKAAKDDNLATLKACMGNWAAQQADEKSWSADNEKGRTNVQEVAALLAAMSADGLALIEQNTVGNYAVVAARRGDALHLVRVVREAPENAEGEAAKKQNWMLASSFGADYRVDYNAPGLKAIRDAIEAGEGAKIREYIPEEQRAALELLKGVQEGVDPFDLLVKRLQKIIKTADAPRILLSRNMSGFQNDLAYWFHKEGSNAFLALSFIDEFDWETKKYSTRVELNLGDISQFHSNAGEYFKQFVSDFDWG